MSARYTLEIRLPEGVTFALPLAGPVSRCLAFLLDFLVISALTTAIQRILAAFVISQQDERALVVAAYIAIWLLYGALAEYFWNGQTLGKWLLGLRVVDAAGLELQFYQVAVRNLTRAIDLFPVIGLAGGITMLCNRRVQRLGDLAAGTVVVRNNQPPVPNIEALVKGRYNSFLQHQLLCARLRQRAPAQAGAIAIDTLMRRDRLDDRARVAIFDDLAAYFCTLVEFPAEDTEQISSEQYVRNVVEILFLSGKRPALAKTAVSITAR
ncbi:MAG TPA: RDD family protein [Bryobacteraceae bacterium]|nr:RDD family protein [Bryobacteraceae bacterium]